jgi:Vitamin B12 dependent methionine synthase, activation domain
MTAPLLAARPLVLTDLPVRIDRDEVLRFQGYKAGLDVPSAEVMTLFEAALALGDRLSVPRVVYRAFSAETMASAIRVAPDRGVSLSRAVRPFRIPEIDRLWGRIEHVGVALCTIGDGLERRVAELFDARELPLAVMLDSVGSAAVESLAEYANDWLCQQGIPLGLKVTNRISPGYAGWDVTDQRALFALCPGAAAAGITLNDACFMRPLKSISFLVGIGSEARVDHYFTQCRRCWMRDCAYRRAPARSTVSRA